MKTKNILCLLCFIFCMFLYQNARTQTHHDIKVNLVDWLNLDPSIFWEYNPDNTLAYEFGINYEFDKLDIIIPTNAPVLQIPFDFKQQYLTLSAAVRYYFFPKKNSGGLYTGIASAFRVKTRLDPNYDIIYKELHQRESGFHDYKSIFGGLTLGFKWLIKNKIIVEPEYVFGGEISWLNHNQSLLFDGKLRLKLGYRFTQKSQEEKIEIH